jgi:2-amino-4-hydroxy-6-hydroxymethyldihydropteridine diphosphokinase
MLKSSNKNFVSPEIFLSQNLHYAAIALGSNIGDRANNLLSAITLLINSGLNIVASSYIYETAPEDYLDQNAFLNMVVLVSDNQLMPPSDLLILCLEIEKELKRERIIAKGPRTIDLDIVLYDNLVIETTKDLAKHYPSSKNFPLELILPHPRMHERAFVLVPLVDLIPNYLHPKLGLSYQTLLEKLNFEGKVTRYKG